MISIDEQQRTSGIAQYSIAYSASLSWHIARSQLAHELRLDILRAHTAHFKFGRRTDSLRLRSENETTKKCIGAAGRGAQREAFDDDDDDASNETGGIKKFFFCIKCKKCLQSDFRCPIFYLSRGNHATVLLNTVRMKTLCYIYIALESNHMGKIALVMKKKKKERT